LEDGTLWLQAQSPCLMVLGGWGGGSIPASVGVLGVPEPVVACSSPPEAWPPGVGLPFTPKRHIEKFHEWPARKPHSCATLHVPAPRGVQEAVCTHSSLGASTAVVS
jgi:hypothetical protein